MNNKDKFKKSIEKINIDEDLVNKMINRVKNEVKFEEKNVAKSESNNVVKFELKDEKNNEVKNVKGDDENMKKGKILKFIKTISLSAAAMVVITTVGVGSYATISGDTRILKNFGINLEGSEQKIEVVENNTEFESGISYTIDYEGSMILNKQEGVDIYESPYNEKDNEKLNVYMKVYSLNDTECEDFRKNLVVEINKVQHVYDTYEIEGIKEVKIGKEDYKATLYYITDGKFDSDSRVRNVYIIEAGNKQNLIIETIYFTEAEEGWGDTFRALFSTLEIKNYKPNDVSNNNSAEVTNKENTAETEDKKGTDNTEAGKNEGSYEGMKNKFEDAGIIKIEEVKYSPDISGYSSTHYDAEIDLLHKKATITSTYYANDEEPKILKKKEIALSEDDAERLYMYYEERLENESKYDYYAREEYAKKIYNEQNDLWGTIEGTYYYSFEADGVSDVYVFGNAEDIQFLHGLFDYVR